MAGRAARAAGVFLLLGIALLSGCFEEGTGERYEPILPQPDPVEDPTAVATPPVTDPVTTPTEYLDAGPLQFRIQWDGSTVPTSEYVRGVDAAAGEQERGFADPEPDAGADGGN
ncbi:MAG: hypothetical protein RL685_5867 [Pseudomonadota bacterium]|jgi:hypothetical protein